MELYNVLLILRCSADTAEINLMVFLIHIVLRSGAEIRDLGNRARPPSIYEHIENFTKDLEIRRDL